MRGANILPIDLLNCLKDVSLPIYKEKAIYRQGRFKWSVSFGLHPINVPPLPGHQSNLSEGDVFIRVNTNASQIRATQVWYLSSTSALVWKTIVPLRDIRYIGGDPYVLAINHHEPSWILTRSAAHPQMSNRLNGMDHHSSLILTNIRFPASAQTEYMQAKKQTSAKKLEQRGGRRKASNPH